MYLNTLNNEELSHLPISYKLQDGNIVCGFNLLTDAELITHGFLSLTDTTPAFDSTYQQKTTKEYTIYSGYADVCYAVEDIAPQDYHIFQRLITFAKEKDIVLDEIGNLLLCNNSVWVQEATTFSRLYVETWQAYYAYTGTSWQELEATLPPLTW